MEEEFEEEEVWAVMREIGDESPDNRKPKGAPSSSSTKPSSASKKIPRSNSHGDENRGGAATRNSAPVTVTSWCKSLGVGELGGGCNNEEEDDGDEEEEDRVPPHVWIAKKMERARISSFSVCEGAGRTLKGRDQRRVRNAVLMGTGFLE